MDQKEKEKKLRRLNSVEREFIQTFDLLFKLSEEEQNDLRLASRCSLIEKKLIAFDLDKNSEYQGMYQRLKQEFEKHKMQTKVSDGIKKIRRKNAVSFGKAWIWYCLGLMFGIFLGGLFL